MMTTSKSSSSGGEPFIKDARKEEKLEEKLCLARKKVQRISVNGELVPVQEISH